MTVAAHKVGPWADLRQLEHSLAITIACCRKDDSLVRVVNEFGRKINWQRVIHRAKENRVLALLLSALGQISVDDYVPPATLHEAHRCARTMRQRSLWMSHWVLRLLDLAQAEGIFLLPYKGPVLAQRLYGNPTLRNFSDLDFFVRHRDLRRAIQVFAHLRLNPVFFPPPRFLSLIERNECEFALSCAEHLRVELHWSVLPRNCCVPLGMDEIYDRLVPVEFFGRQLHDLNPEDLFLVLTLHANKHYWSRMIWLSDLARLLTVYPDFDWEALWQRASDIHVQRVVLLAAYLLRQLLGNDIPESFAARIQRQEAFPSLLSQVLRNMERGKGSELHNYLSFLRTRERWRDRFWQLAYRAFAPGIADFKSDAVPTPLYVPLHFARIVKAIVGFNGPRR